MSPTNMSGPGLAPDQIARLDAAIGGRSPEQACLAVQSLLPLMVDDLVQDLPAAIFQPVDGHYARRLLHVSPALGYSVVAMTWAPGQGTPLHDHDHQWCTDVVLQGVLDVTTYQKGDQTAAGWHFTPGAVLRQQRGQCSALIPPAEYHTVRNPDLAAIAVSLHVYQGTIDHCSVFEPVGDTWQPRRISTWLD